MTFIMVVDDEQNVLNAIQRMLHPLGNSVETFTSPEVALEHAKNAEVDLVIADYLMPEMSGAEFLEKVTALKPKVKKILLSGHDDLDGLLNISKEIRTHHFVRKPWDHYIFLDIISRLLSEHEVDQTIHALEQRLSQQEEIINKQQKMLQQLEKASGIKAVPDDK